MDDLQNLNPAQRAAVEHPGGPLLVIAGAGSGKTRVLTARVAMLLARGEPAESLVAFTFTNRAAREMRERIERQVGGAAGALWVGTFHATCVRLLRREAKALGIPRDFSIYDREDQEGAVTDVLRRLELPEASYRTAVVLARISDAKNALVTPEQMARAAVVPYEQRVAECYAAYQRALREAGALDFDDLIAEAVRMLTDHPEIGERYARRFRHVLVDEYQDTNHAQFLLVRALGAQHRNVFVVGDDDQSIYGWRGANLANVLEFETAFPGAEVVRLEQNYRSTANILRAANAVIANNRSRRGKTLWCEREDGAPLHFWLEGDEVGEATRVRRLLRDHLTRGGVLADCAVLYRTNSQSRALEMELRQAHLAYEIVGGVSFFQRREVKDLLAYLRLVVNPADAAAFWRVWNTPRRGLGPAVRALVEERVGRGGATPSEALAELAARGALTRAAQTGASAFLGLLADLRVAQEEPLDRTFATLLERTQYLEALEGLDDAAERRANVQELGAAALAFAAEERGGLAAFLAETALVSDIDRMSEDADRVRLLTAHNAKGLEFSLVIVTGLEEGLFPHASGLQEGDRLEEERRLFYVAITRAKDAVHLTAAAYRRRFDGARGGAVSRFVDEIPFELLERSGFARPADRAPHSWRHGTPPDGHPDSWVGSSGRGASLAAPARHRAIGREVYHETFGRGVVVEAEGEGGDARFTVRFRAGVKKVLGRFLSAREDSDGA